MSGAAQVRRSPGAEGDPAPRARQRQAHRPLFAESSSQSLIEFHEVAALAAIAFLGALVFGITGFGAALVTIPLATRLVPLKFALALFAFTRKIVLRISGDVLMRAVAAMLLVSGSSLVWRALG
jgi:uncharacterized membrane protein YfcA